MNEALRKTLKKLRLSGLLESLEIRLQEAAGHGLSHGEFLELILQDELAVRGDRQLAATGQGGRSSASGRPWTTSTGRSTRRSSEADLRPGDLPVPPRGAGRALAGPAGSGQELPGPGDRLPGDQGRVHGALPLDLRPGPRLPARRGAWAGGQGADASISSPTC